MDETTTAMDDDPARAAAVGLALSGVSAEEAREFLRQQSVLTALQIDRIRAQDDGIEEQQRLELSHLRVRRIGDYARVLLEGFIAIVLLVGVVLGGMMVWSAATASGLAVDPFSVPSDLAARGASGEVTANQFAARLNQMSNNDQFYAQAGEIYRDAGSGEINVVIPQTSITVGALNQYLRRTLGNETHLTGQIVHNGKALTLFLKFGASDITVTEPEGDFDKLVQKGAEAVFAADRPLRYDEYLRINGRLPEATALIMALSRSGSKEQRAMALSDWGVILSDRGDFSGAIAKYRASAAIDPANPLPAVYLGFAYIAISRQQLALTNLERAIALWTPERLNALGPVIARTTLPDLRATVMTYKGDFAGAADNARRSRELDAVGAVDVEGYLGREIANETLAHNIIAVRAAQVLQAPDEVLQLWQEAAVAESLGDSRGAVHWAAKAQATNAQIPLMPLYFNALGNLAVMLAREGDFKEADAIIAKLPPDNDLTRSARGQVAAVEGDMREAEAVFRAMEAGSPDIPYADAFWGEALLWHGDYDAAIAKFEQAHRIGPRFVDPLELWGEALMLQNRSDLALAKFQEAANLAPHWGHLHLKWGEALYWSGRAEDARKQFALAAALALSPNDKAELVRFRAKV